jgi:hypothetical protein
MQAAAAVLSLLLPLLVVAGPGAAATLTYVATLSGAAEVPDNPSPGTGQVTVEIENDTTMLIALTFSGLVGTTTAAHIHNAPAGANGPVMTQLPSFIGFPPGVSAGNYAESFDLTAAASWNPSFVTTSGGVDEARLAFLSALASGSAYFNLHSTTYPGGELRGQLQPPVIPLPATGALAFAAFGLLGAARLRRG